MKRGGTAALIAGIVMVAVSALVFAEPPERQANTPGLPTEPRVVVGNSRTQPVPVILAVAGEVQPVSVVGAPVVTIAESSTVTTWTGRQRWAYRSVVVEGDDDPAVALEALGLEGWEAVTATPTDGGAVRVLLKRPN